MKRIILFFVILVTCAAGTYFAFSKNGTNEASQQPGVLAAQSREIPALDAIIVQSDAASNRSRVLSCGKKGCETKVPPTSSITSVISNGEVWYRYRDREEEGKPSIRVLERIDAQGNVRSITEQNALVQPRDMMVSGDGTKVAYFLDNIHDDSNLTELWVYDSNTGGTHVVAEQLKRQDIASSVRWNAASNVLWFLEEGKNGSSLVLIPLSTQQASTAVQRIPWKQRAATVDKGVMDISSDASRIAVVQNLIPSFSQIVVRTNGQGNGNKKTVKGNVVFMQWMQDASLLYAVQHDGVLTFWIANTSTEWPVARMKAAFQSAHSTGSLDLAAFLADPRYGETHLYVLHMKTGQLKDQLVLPSMVGGKSYLVQVNEAAALQDEAIATITAELSDSVLTAFVQSNIGAIAEDEHAQAIRIITTEHSNTIYIDYRQGALLPVERILLTVQDAIYPSWKVLARYTVRGGQWQRLGASSMDDPAGKRVYEWEESVSQWILKVSH